MKLTCYVNPSVNPPISFVETTALYAWNTYEIVLIAPAFRSDSNPVTLQLSCGALTINTTFSADPIHPDWRIGTLLLTDSLFQTLYNKANSGHETDTYPQSYVQSADFTLTYDDSPLVATTVPVILTSSSSSSSTNVTVDLALSSTSSNPVQNKAIKAALDGKQDNLGVTLSTSVGNSATSVPTSKAVYDYVNAISIPSITVASSVVSGGKNPVSGDAVYKFIYDSGSTGLNTRVVALETAYADLNAAVENKASNAVATDSKDGLMSSSDFTKLRGLSSETNSITVDTVLDKESGNAVANRAVTEGINGKQKDLGIESVDTLTLSGSSTAIPSSELIQTLLSTKVSSDFIDTKDLSNDDTKVPSSKLVKSKLDSIKQFDYSVDIAALTATDKISIPCSQLVKSLLDDKQGLLTIDKSLTTSDDSVPSSNAVKSAVNTLTSSLNGKVNTASILSTVPNNSVDNTTVLGSKLITELLAEKQNDLSLDAVDTVIPLSAVDTHVPSSKIVASELEKKVDKSSIVSEFSSSVTTDDTYVPSAKLVKSKIDAITQLSPISTISSCINIDTFSIHNTSLAIPLSFDIKHYMLVLSQSETTSTPLTRTYCIDFNCSNLYHTDSSGHVVFYFLDFYFVVCSASLAADSIVELKFFCTSTGATRRSTLSLSGAETWSSSNMTSSNIDENKVTLTVSRDPTTTKSDATIIHFLGFPTVDYYNLYGSIVRKGSTHTITISS